MSKTPGGVENPALGPNGTAGHGRAQRPWTWDELCVVWDHPDWTAREISDELLPHRSPGAVRRVRERWGRFRSGRVPTCSRCGERPVWTESPRARRMGLCKGCYLDEERMRMEDQRRADALRQRRLRERRRRGADGGE